MVSDFLNSRNSNEKIFNTVEKASLAIYVGGDTLPASYISNLLLGLPPPIWIPETYESDTHCATVNVRACGSFLVADKRKENQTPKWVLVHAQ